MLLPYPHCWNHRRISPSWMQLFAFSYLVMNCLCWSFPVCRQLPGPCLLSRPESFQELKAWPLHLLYWEEICLNASHYLVIRPGLRLSSGHMCFLKYTEGIFFRNWLKVAFLCSFDGCIRLINTWKRKATGSQRLSPWSCDCLGPLHSRALLGENE